MTQSRSRTRIPPRPKPAFRAIDASIQPSLWYINPGGSGFALPEVLRIPCGIAPIVRNLIALDARSTGPKAGGAAPPRGRGRFRSIPRAGPLPALHAVGPV